MISKTVTKKFIYISLLCAFFVYGLLVGLYKIFPFQQLIVLKNYLEYSTGTFEKQRPIESFDSIEIYETSLQRLLIKKIPIIGFSGLGGGLSNANEILYIITNKGLVKTFKSKNFAPIENDISEVPMNLDDLILSGHPYNNDFKIEWFRVNGIYSEKMNNNNYLLFASHNAYDKERDCITHNISRSVISVNDMFIKQTNDWTTIFKASPCIDPVPEKIFAVTPYPGHISGGPIANIDEHNLLVAIGDYNRHGIDGTDKWATDDSNPYGKSILLDKSSGKWSVYTKGNRNISGLYIDKDSTIWSIENGPEGGDELNILVEGENYGWPEVSYGIWYDHMFEFSGGSKRGMHPIYKKPIFSWIPSIAPRGLTKIDGTKFQYWSGDLLMGTMRDQSLHRLRLNKDNQVVYDERIEIGHRIRDLITLADDKIALMTDDGYLVIIEDGGPVFYEMDPNAKERMASLNNYFDKFANEIEETTPDVYKNSARAIFQQNCASCHNLNATNQIGPHLKNVLNREIGNVDGFNYSWTLKSDKRNWDASLLKSFLEHPEDKFPGTKMQKINLSPIEIDSIIQFFKSQNMNK